MKQTKYCPVCGDPFTKASQARYCSEACRQKAKRNRKEDYLNKEFAEKDAYKEYLQIRQIALKRVQDLNEEMHSKWKEYEKQSENLYKDLSDRIHDESSKVRYKLLDNIHSLHDVASNERKSIKEKIDAIYKENNDTYETMCHQWLAK